MEVPNNIWTVTVAVGSGALSAVVSALLTYLSISVQVRKDLEAKYDIDLRNQRLNVYKELWQLLEPLAKYARPGPFTSSVAEGLLQVLRRWYFETGGLFMSENTRNAYFALMDNLRTFAEDHSRSAEVPLCESELELLLANGSTLRTNMAQDVGSRRAPMFRPS